MQSFSLKDTLIIKKFTKSDFHRDTDLDTYFNIIFIEEGKGRHFINEFIITYKTGDIFIVTSEDKHRFEIDEETTFYHFQFTKTMFSNKVDLLDRSYWLHRIEGIIHSPDLETGDIISDPYDKELLWKILNLIMNEFEMGKEFFKQNISNMVCTTLSIIARNIKAYHLTDNATGKEYATTDQILTYIRQHVYDRDRMKVSALAAQFNMTSSTLSSCFKKKTGDSVHHYILMYKLVLVKYRLLHTDFTVAEIAHQLGFTDESHLTRIFKKYNGITPKQFKTSAETAEIELPK